ncbi:MAG: nuclear transport factor 2 family protein [Solirubrobacteraceae bacterium]
MAAAAAELRSGPLALALARWDTSRMTPEESDPTAEEIDPTPEAIVEAIGAGHLVEATRANWRAFNARSISGEVFDPEELVAFHPEVEWTTRTDLPDSRTYRGREGLASLIAEWSGVFDGFLFEPVEIFETGGKVVVVLQVSGRIRGSEQQVAMEEVHVMSLRDGMFSEVREYPTRSEALTALGLSESMTFADRFVKPA